MNKGLHDLHTVWAGRHLRDIKRALKHIEPQAMFSRHAAYAALRAERNKLIRKNPAYQEAAWRLAADQLPLYEECVCGWYEPANETEADARNRLDTRSHAEPIE